MNLVRKLFLGFMIVFAASFVLAQEQAAPAAPSPDKVEAAPANQAAVKPEPSASPSEQLAHASKEAAGEEEGDHSEFKRSSSVQFVAKLTGLSLNGAYWLMVILNFAIIAGLVAWALKKNLPAAFRTRTETIRKSMDEARRASEDANCRLAEIEGRLSKLDSEISTMKNKADADAAAEEERIRVSAEEDGRKIIASAEQEIEAVAKIARRDLKAYAAELAIALAEKRIAVDPKTDEALVNRFVDQLGKDGRQ